ncbi:uncharacterized protein LOC108145858 [Drosophila elegans]|uniref:uncharacterized protein LOC108145858 n=1 Tax=Drosophila elegans TaxID=30023 RepID=UPI0007E79939|nr:uncharacterized protein LOC108145858 [Drosophila elegans]
MSRVHKMAWSNVGIFLKLSSQRCQLLSLGSKKEVSGGLSTGKLKSDVLVSTSNARYMECLFSKWTKDNNSVHGTWQRFFKDLVYEEGETTMPAPCQFYPNPIASPDQLRKDVSISLPPKQEVTLPKESPHKSHEAKPLESGTKLSASTADKVGSCSPMANHLIDVSKGSPVLVRKTTKSPPVLKNQSSISKSTSEQLDSNTCVVCPQKVDMNVLALSPEIRTSGLSGCQDVLQFSTSCIKKREGSSILTVNEMENKFSKNQTRKFCQKKPPEELNLPTMSTEVKDSLGSQRTAYARNNFKTKFGSLSTFMKYWRQACRKSHLKRVSGPEMVVKRSTKANSKPRNIMYFKSYYEKNLSQGKDKVAKTANEKPLKPKDENSKEQPEPRHFKSNDNKIQVFGYQAEDEDSPKMKLEAEDITLKATEPPNKTESEGHSTSSKPKNKTDTYETLEDLINDIDDTTLDRDMIDPIEPEIKDSKTSKLLENTSKKNPTAYKTTLRVFKSKLKGNTKNDKKVKPKPEALKPLRIFNADQKGPPKVKPTEEDKSWIYSDEITLKNFKKPTNDTKKSTLKTPGVGKSPISDLKNNSIKKPLDENTRKNKKTE